LSWGQALLTPEAEGPTFEAKVWEQRRDSWGGGSTNVLSMHYEPRKHV